MRTSNYSEAGHNHANEDRIKVARHSFDAQFCTLADGMGGQAGGAQAATIAVQAAREMASSSSIEDLCREASWLQILSSADDAVEADASAGFTTLIAFCIGEDFICGASCGDSAILLLHNDKPILLTENQRKSPPVGSSAAQPVGFSQKLEAPWKVLAMSDGVWKFVGWDAMTENCRSFDGTNLILKLRELAAGNANKLPDDFTIALFES